MKWEYVKWEDLPIESDLEIKDFDSRKKHRKSSYMG